MRRYIVAGAPCSGKSSYVRAHAQAGELIYDYDTLHRALSGLDAHQHDPVIRDYVLVARDAILAHLAAHRKQPAWVITSTRSNAELNALREWLAAEVILLSVTPEEAHRRCIVDKRPEVWHEYIDNWFAETDIAAAEWPLPEIKMGETHMQKKTFTAPMMVKEDGEPGEFTAVFATLNVIDHDGDVTVPGAFQDGQEVVIEAWNHNYGELPVGVGTIREEGDKAVVDGRFFLDTPGGLAHYKTVKALGPLAEWSYTFNILESKLGTFEADGETADVRFLQKLDVWGASPVQRGAGIDTGTVYVKGAKGAIRSHSTETTDAAWDGPANVARLRSDESAAYYRRMFAWVDPEGDPATKSAYALPHHMVNQNGDIGAANVRACQSAIGVLNGGRGGSRIPDGDRRAVWNHLARHLRDADVEPPELKRLDSLGKGEGQTEDNDNGEPSGPTLQVVLTEIDIQLLEEE